MGKILFHFFAMMAEYQADVIAEDIQKGLASARARGRLGGRPKKIDAKKRKRIREM